MPSSKAEALPCSARAADGALRGAGLGLLWGVWYGPGEASAARAGGSSLHPLVYGLRFAGTSALGFAALISTYNGLYCAGEKMLGTSVANPLIAGGAIGTAIGYVLTPGKLLPISATAFGTAALCVSAQLVLSGWSRPETSMGQQGRPNRSQRR